MAGLSQDTPWAMVRGEKGWHVVELLGRRTVTLDQVRAVLEEKLCSGPATAEEKKTYFHRLRESVTIERADPDSIVEAWGPAAISD